jgi:tetratricopeptide (TPR) repeat protein
LAKIALRDYQAGIDELIEDKKFVEAIAHCRHILRIYPKNIATYRLLGKTHLEEKRYQDALDIFQRVLSSIPDDFVSHVGMSLVREEEGNQDAAISHMEKAFEGQPSNRAVQDELRRLYGEREGFTPPKVRLTRPALARMYAHGDLYNQAIGELRGAITEDGPRPELLVLLAEMYVRVGQDGEALQICSDLLDQLPYCLFAAQIQGEIYTRRDQHAKAKEQFDKVAELDPYQALASFGENPKDIPSEQIMIEHLVLHTGELNLEDIPRAWTGALDPLIADGQEASAENLPEWLSLTESESKENEEAPISTSELKALQELEPEGTAELDANAALPSWMQELREDEVEKLQGNENDDEVKPFGRPAEEIKDEELISKGLEETGSEDDLAWLESLAQTQGTDESELTTDSKMREQAHPEFLPDEGPQELASNKRSLTWWLDELEEAENVQAFDRTKELNDVDIEKPNEIEEIRGLDPGGTDTKEIVEEQDAETDKSQLLDDNAVTDWLTELENKDGEEQQTSEEPIQPEIIDSEPEIANPENSEAAPDWLKELAANAESTEQPTKKKTTDALESPPDWLDELREASEEDPQDNDAANEGADNQPNLENEWESSDEEQGTEQESNDLDDLINATDQNDWVPEKEIAPSENVESETREDSLAQTPEPISNLALPKADKKGALSATDKLPESQSNDQSLADAREALNELDLQRAAKHYEEAIASRNQVTSVIEDLEAALKRFPDKIILLQTLGDAYMRADRLKEALDCYTKAEDLI